MKPYILNSKLFFLTVISIILSKTSAFISICGSTYIGWICHIFLLLAFIPMIKYAISNKNGTFTAYMIVISLGFIFHVAIGKPDLLDNFWEISYWMLVIYLMHISREYRPQILLFLALAFYSTECGIAVYERITTNRLFTYDTDIMEGFVTIGDSIASEFRSFSLLGHPLNNANVVSLFMGFLLVNNSLKNKYKVVLLSLGILALWAFNSRGAILIWIMILLFRFALYNAKPSRVIILGIILVLTGPYIISWIESGALGRFSFDFSDASSQTRLSSFLFFAAHHWTFENILFGGDLIYMPGSDYLLENGILLSLSYWGWIVGSLKILLEITITYKLLYKYKKKERFIILLSFWGVALMNNNVFNSLVITFFLFAYAALYVYDIKQPILKRRQ